MPKQNFLIILCGLPASGKSTFAFKFKSILEMTREKAKVTIIDPDRIRKDLYSGFFNYKKESLVRKKNLKEIQKALEKGKIVISDDLNYYTSMRHDLKDVAEKVKVAFYIIHISTPIEQCIIWNKQRGEPIPNEVIYKINEKFDLFNTYAWDKPFRTLNLKKNLDLEGKIKLLLKEIEHDIKLNSELDSMQKTEKTKNRYNEKLDQITRKIVNNYVKGLKDESLIKKLVSLRKVFIKQNLDKVMSNSEIKKKFTNFLKMELKEENFNFFHQNNFKK
ncbi:MAG: adenylyl-sulfate kinase [Promethearchaeota archaeon]|nr:MAG: adenylyl-sulfate kinase [Candidatus Lokiarchaeota archaeon]